MYFWVRKSYLKQGVKKLSAVNVTRHKARLRLCLILKPSEGTTSVAIEPNRYYFTIIIMKNILKFALLVIVTAIAFLVVSSILPYSQGFKTGTKTSDPFALVYVLLSIAWTCFAITFIVKHSPWSASRLMPVLIISLFFVYSFMAQVETFFFSSAFKILTYRDIFLIMLGNGTIIFAGVPLSIKLFGNKKEKPVQNTAKNLQIINELIIKLSIIGLIYVVVYFVFGYFVAWQAKDLRVFYSGHPEDNGFLASLVNNFHENPVIFPFQFVRGVLFSLFVLPLVNMFKGQSGVLLISLILVFLSLGMGLIIPNFLFPDTVRWAHFREMISSMFVFAIIVWFVYDKLNLSKKVADT